MTVPSLMALSHRLCEDGLQYDRSRRAKTVMREQPAPRGGIHALDGQLRARRRVARWVAVAAFVGLLAATSFGSSSWPFALPLMVIWAIATAISVTHLSTMSISRRIGLAAPIEKVFDKIAEPERWGWGGSWLGRFTRVLATEHLPGGGTRGVLAAKSLGLPAWVAWDTIAFEPPRRLVIAGRARRLGLAYAAQRTEWTLEPQGVGTEARYECEVRFLAAPLLSGTRLAARLTDRMLAELQRSVEAPTGDPLPWLGSPAERSAVESEAARLNALAAEVSLWLHRSRQGPQETPALTAAIGRVESAKVPWEEVISALSDNPAPAVQEALVPRFEALSADLEAALLNVGDGLRQQDVMPGRRWPTV